jgi:hypothetical protein
MTQAMRLARRLQAFNGFLLQGQVKNRHSNYNFGGKETLLLYQAGMEETRHDELVKAGHNR